MIHLSFAATMLLWRLFLQPAAESAGYAAPPSAVSPPFCLARPSPNPCTDRAVFLYHIAAPAFVRLQILNLKGNELIDLEAEARPSGHYQVQFNVAPLRPGLYFSRLIARTHTASFVHTRKMMVY